MKKPILFVVDDDPQVVRAIRRDLRSRYKMEYRILSTNSVREALEVLVTLKKKGESIALFLSDQRMPEMLGVDFLEKTKQWYPTAKRVLLTAYSDKEAAIQAINKVQLDYYLMKPWNPPEEKLYPILDDLLEEWQSHYIPDFQGLRVIGYQYSKASHELKDFLAGNLVPYQWEDVHQSEKGKSLQDLHALQAADLPAVILTSGEVLKKPKPIELAAHIGLHAKAKENLYDVAIIGAGPAGLAAAVYGASEGLRTLLIERRAPGGQAGTSSRIENYLGFPNGLSGGELARRAITQATRFGTEFLAPQEVKQIECKENYKVLELEDGSRINARSIVITTGVAYRKLAIDGIDAFTGAGVYYGAAMTEARSCENRIVYIVGGGNSAGQGAVYLSQFAKEVHILIRKPDLSSSMSAYLIEQIEHTPNITVHGHQQITAVKGNDHLQQLTISCLKTGSCKEVNTNALFIFIGARPYTEWLGEAVLKSDKGFVITGPELTQEKNFRTTWKKTRAPFLLETSVPGIFAAGDVRAGAMNRVASAVGEGAMAIKFVHSYLATQ